MAEITSRCTRLDENIPGRGGVAKIIGWSLAAAVSIVAVVLFGVPLAADRLTPLLPPAFERRLGEVADGQVKVIFGKQVCSNAAGQQAFAKLVNTLRETAGLDTSVQTAVLSSHVPNAFALPGGKVYLFSALLAKAENADEIAGVLAHELGHLKHRDNMRELIYNGGTSFLIGLLFGDVTGSGAMVFASRSLVTASYSREAEQNADTFAIEVMPARPLAEADGRIDVSCHRQAGRPHPNISGEPSLDPGPAGTHEQRGSAANRAAAIDAGGMGFAQGDLWREGLKSLWQNRRVLDISTRRPCERRDP
jgi:Zn-dependent protease with chaperone function